MRAHIDSSATAAERIVERAYRAGEHNEATRDAHAHTDAWQRLLDRYLQGWAEANPTHIFFATARAYRFSDPLVGQFSRWSIPLYFEHLRGRFARSGQTGTRELALNSAAPSTDRHGRTSCDSFAKRRGWG